MRGAWSPRRCFAALGIRLGASRPAMPASAGVKRHGDQAPRIEIIRVGQVVEIRGRPVVVSVLARISPKTIIDCQCGCSWTGTCSRGQKWNWLVPIQPELRRCAAGRYARQGYGPARSPAPGPRSRFGGARRQRTAQPQSEKSRWRFHFGSRKRRVSRSHSRSRPRPVS